MKYKILQQQECSDSILFVKQPSHPEHVITMTRVGTDNPTDTFVYNLSNIGSSQPHLEYIILGICPEITAEDIESVTVNGNPATFTIISNPAANCNGLKVNIELLSGQTPTTANLVITFAEPFAVGPNTVCFGVQNGNGPITEEELDGNICGPVCETPPTEVCPVTAFKIVDVTVPITVTPTADVDDDDIMVTCCGEPVVSNEPPEMQEPPQTSCTFFITQSLCVEVPVTFSATGTVGEQVVNCDSEPTLEPCDCDGNDGGEGITPNITPVQTRFINRATK